MTERRTGLLAGLVIALAALAAYQNSLSAPFVFDDTDSIINNPTIVRLWPIGPVLSPPAATGQTVGGRPVLNLSLAADYAISGLGVWSYHATNLLIHILSGLTLFGIARRTLGRRDSATLLAFAVALLWTLHPLQTESVTYVIQRAESLMGLFYLLTLYCFIRGTEDATEVGRLVAKAQELGPREASSRRAGDNPRYLGALADRANQEPVARWGWFMLSVVACLLGMATKEVMVSAPVLVFLYDRTFVSGNFRSAWRGHRGFYVALAGTWILLACLVLPNHQRGGSTGFGSGISWGIYLLTQFPAITRYLLLSVWPHPLIFDYGTRWTAGRAMTIVSTAIVLGIMAATVIALLRPKKRGFLLRQGFGGQVGGRVDWQAFGFAGAWFFAILAPTSLVPGNRQTLAEHRMYLALAPVIVVLVVGLNALWARAGRSTWATLLTCLLVGAAAGTLTARRNEDYRSNLSLWGDTVAKLPGNPYAQADLGVALDQSGDEVGALAHYTEALRLKPDLHDLHRAHDDMGIALGKLGRIPEARAQFEEALRYNPDFPAAHNDLGNALRLEGHLAEAEAQLREALRLQPDYVTAWLSLALVLGQTGRLPEAIAAYQRAVALQPSDPQAHFHLANALAQAGRLPEAAAEYQRTLQLNPRNAGAHYNLGRALEAMGRRDEASRELAEAAQLGAGR